MKIKGVFALIVLVCILLSGCGQAQAEAGSQPQTSSAETSSTTAPVPSEVMDPPAQDIEPPAPIKQEVTPKGSFHWEHWFSQTFQFVDREKYKPVIVEFQYSQPLDSMDRVYYVGSIPALLAQEEDGYYVVYLTTHPMVFSMYGVPDGSEEYTALLKSTCAELRQRLEEAGYPILEGYEHGDYEEMRVITVMSVAEMKALNCGDDMSVEIDAYYHPTHA